MGTWVLSLKQWGQIHRLNLACLGVITKGDHLGVAGGEGQGEAGGWQLVGVLGLVQGLGQ